MKRFAFIFLTCCCVSYLFSQSLFESALDDEVSTNSSEASTSSISMNGYVRGSVFGGGEKYDLATTFAEFALQTNLSKGKTFLNSDIRFRTGLFFDQNEQQIQFKELYAGYYDDMFSITLGNQIVNWGRTDGFNPTNNITPDDFFFLTADPDDQKLSNFMLRTKIRASQTVDIELIGIPFYVPSNYRYELFDLGPNVTFGEGVYPEKKLKNGAIAGRMNFDLSQIGWSLSYFNGYDPYHGFDVQGVSLSNFKLMLTNVASSYRKQTIGADFAIPIQNWIVRGEMAYNITDNPDNKMYIPASDFSYVGGLEANYNGYIIIAQYIGKVVPKFEELTEPVLTNPLSILSIVRYVKGIIDYENRLFNRKIFDQQEKTNHAASFTITKSFGYDAWNAELTAYRNFTSNESLIRPKLTWKIDDSLAAAIGANYMNGDEKTMFGNASKIMNGAFIELKATF